MFKELQQLYPTGPTNRTDPIVRHDPSVKWGNVVKTLTVQNDSSEKTGRQGQQIDTLKVDGIFVPIVKLNNYVLTTDHIIWMKLYNDRFTPYLDITVNDKLGDIQLRDVPGLNNVITVVITAPVDGVYKKIVLDFYITNVIYNGTTITYSAELRLLPFEKNHLKQIKFYHPSPGCSAKECKLGPNDHPTTYELLHVLALEAGLGFAATQQTKEIKDDRYRLAQAEKYKDIIQKHIKFGGLDENSIFDAWVDLYGYLVMVNVPWVMNEKVKPNELGIIPMANPIATSDNTNTTKADDKMVHRLITNFNGMSAENNLMIHSWDNIVDTTANFYNGTNNTYNLMIPKGNGGENNVETLNITQKEISQDGINEPDEYTFECTSFDGFEMNSLNGTLKQKRNHDKYFERIRSRMLKVTLERPNLGIERGTLISVMIFEQTAEGKRAITANTASIFGDKSQDDPGVFPMEYVTDARIALPNPAISGIYYIDGMDFEYDEDSQRIWQSLYLIKKGNLTNLNYKTVPNKVASEQ